MNTASKRAVAVTTTLSITALSGGSISTHDKMDLTMTSHITPAPGAATLTCAASVATVNGLSNMLDRQDGLVSHAGAAKHLSSLLSAEIERVFSSRRGKPLGPCGSMQFTVHPTTIETMDWLCGEMERLSRELSDMTGEFSNDFTEIANAAYDAEKSNA